MPWRFGSDHFPFQMGALQVSAVNLPGRNIEPENDGWEDDFHFRVYFSGVYPPTPLRTLSNRNILLQGC